VFNGTFSKNNLYRAIGVSCRVERQDIHPNSRKQYISLPLPLETIPSPWLGFLKGVFLANHLASTDNLGRTTKR